MERILADAGLQATTIATTGSPMVVGRYEYPANDFTLLLYGHYDVQPADEPDWRTEPFVPLVRNDRLYARGVEDNKGQFYAHIAAIRSYLAVSEQLPVNLIFLIKGEEEVGSTTFRSFLEKNRDRLPANAAIIADGPGHPSHRPVAVLGPVSRLPGTRPAACQGGSTLRSFRRSHPETSLALARLLSQLIISPDRTINVKGFYDRVRPPHAS
ncbi:MAG: M20/M25/M40 family metallo-hydrolase [Trueperaceae bacterium]